MKIVPVDAAVAMIPNGASLMIGGFMGVGTPERIIDDDRASAQKKSHCYCQ